VAGDHGRQEQAREFSKCANVEVDLAEDFCLGYFREFSVGAEAGVVDEDVDGDAFALQLVEEKPGRGRWSSP
jgi:hypothetical protein